MRLYFTRGWAIEFFFKIFLQLLDLLYHMKLGNNNKKTYFCFIPSARVKKPKWKNFDELPIFTCRITGFKI